MAACALLVAPLVRADLPPLLWPVDCVAGENCFVQNFVDRDPGPGVLDHRCGPLAYDGHRGTDIRIAFESEALDGPGVAVRAAAPGRVRRVRDGVADIRVEDPARFAGQACGNGVEMVHPGGWITLYCHLREGSVTARPGQEVAAGETLGLIGLSGLTQFPHLHFELRRGADVIDPYAPDSLEGCSPDESGPGLWAEAPAHVPGALLGLGIAPRMPEGREVQEGRLPEPSGRDAPAIVGWAYAFGLLPGDVLEIVLTGPGGREIARSARPMERVQAQAWRATGRARGAGLWPAGRYELEVRMLRNGRVHDSARHGLDLR